jgi:hypothetical protein
MSFVVAQENEAGLDEELLKAADDGDDAKVIYMINAYIHTYIHTYTHTYIHTYIHVNGGC